MKARPSIGAGGRQGVSDFLRMPSLSLRGISGVGQAILLCLAIALLFVTENLQPSSACGLLWMFLVLVGHASSRPWSLAVLGMLMLNVRQVVLDEGTIPSSHMDMVLIVAAFLCGYGQRRGWWLRTMGAVAVGILIGVIGNFQVVFDFVRFGIEYHALALTKNQTALLAGLAVLCGGTSLAASRNLWTRLLFTGSLGASLLLLRAADSRAGIAMLLVALLLSALLLWCRRPMEAVRSSNPLLRHKKIIIAGGLLLLALAVGLSVLIMSSPDPMLSAGLYQMYGEENLENDASRIRVYSCYLGLPFTGNNRFIYGVGYGSVMRGMCPAEAVGRSLSHAHNLILQIWAETGLVGTLFLLPAMSWILWRVIKNMSKADRSPSLLLLFSGSAIVFYLFLFNMVELGMIKVPVLMILFGTFLAAPFCSTLLVREEA
ncbi:O-antigen ligase family protein [Synechococcus sp. BA-124 BA4]|jgi:O-antigen ligase|uniref:O-antigen ligase family protein n=1 Tax=unclassified Synechococcus TaxID=2626047 RepID=UPI0018CFD148|nr:MULTISPECIES: O-antigen ligase family protein [unclassified Synechococcus]MEA5398440.1 O-antigen ligase family protein [Synechococcus sp. BA-124 BA4]QPN57709.1 O-antigen ligase family protein [Synechococcus sp. CBW1107]CAK6686684.1 hypothetical protein BBFGKLBO_00063 [Synechococcus sp. CBW1107]